MSIRFRFHHTEICFVNSHLAAHVSEVERRNQDFNDILTKTHFSSPMKPKGILDHDIVVWMGDLNYRYLIDICIIADSPIWGDHIPEGSLALLTL